MESVTKRIKQMCTYNIENNTYSEVNLKPHNLVAQYLSRAGMPASLKGYEYLITAVEEVMKDSSMLYGITKILYPDIANKFDTTVSRVERAIRHAIEVSWNRGDWDLMEDIFGHSVDIDKAKPTNSEFIVTVADKLRLEFQRDYIK